jgi:arylsulfatase A-like enzyme
MQNISQRFPFRLLVPGCYTILGSVIPLASAGAEPVKKSNIVIVLADDLGWADVGYNGNRCLETPNIDKLARQGMVFNRFYPSAANCAPSRASMMTGMYSPRHNVYLPQGMARGEVSHRRWLVPTQSMPETHKLFPVSINNVEPRFESLAEMLRKGGYISARLGKWHIGDDNQGFDYSSSDGTPGLIANVGGEEERFYEDTLVAQRLTDAAIDFMCRNKEKPFFLYLSHWEVHSPMTARREAVARFSSRLSTKDCNGVDPVYAAETEQLDISLGRIMACLDSLALTNNTLFIFTSDNGGSLKYTTNGVLRGGKGGFYEGGIRSPFVARWPGMIRPGSTTNWPANGIDLMPTFAEMAEVSLPDKQPVDGISLLPVFRDPDQRSERKMFFHFPLYLGGEEGVSCELPAYDTGKPTWRAVPSTTFIRGDWKMIWYYEYDKYELFNLKEDISEKNNLAGQVPDIEKSLLAEIREWVVAVDAPVPGIPANKKINQ